MVMVVMTSKAKAKAKAKPSAAPVAAASSDSAPVRQERVENSVEEGNFSSPVVDNEGYRLRYVAKQPARMITIGNGQRLHIDCGCVLKAQVEHPAKLQSFYTCECMQRINMDDDILIDEDQRLHSTQICSRISGLATRNHHGNRVGNAE